MVAPRTTWLFRPHIEGEAIPREGVLSLEDGLLRFAGANGHDVEIPLAGVKRARRLRGTPVLQLRYDIGGGEWRMAFVYFSPPPDLEGQWRGTPVTRTDRLGRRRAFGRLNEGNRDLKEILGQWVAEIRGAASAG